MTMSTKYTRPLITPSQHVINIFDTASWLKQTLTIISGDVFNEEIGMDECLDVIAEVLMAYTSGVDIEFLGSLDEFEHLKLSDQVKTHLYQDIQNSMKQYIESSIGAIINTEYIELNQISRDQWTIRQTQQHMVTDFDSPRVYV